ncbi:hypothetical protein ElP_74040 (plasmid) [Tautonia plasticadhaerens]|uniref:Carboxypeptidase regulatory-like domain-containing protein n=1 Tax=Tautonia plasticadhaerens TaxID=2527974 RepID=A0A518HF05_9BACT|nr:hypothetical protein ElP_74040 [Tautonia plasticadhaerens]
MFGWRANSRQDDRSAPATHERSDRSAPATHERSAHRDGRYRASLIAVLILLVVTRVLSFEPTYPVEGRVLVAGEPARGAIVEFHPIGKPGITMARPRGDVREDGSFELSTGAERGGAPAGSYAVTIVWREPLAAGDEGARGPNLIPDFYSRRASTPLRATVLEGMNLLPPFRIEMRRNRRAASSSESRNMRP